jgi:hypothetical protein
MLDRVRIVLGNVDQVRLAKEQILYEGADYIREGH